MWPNMTEGMWPSDGRQQDPKDVTLSLVNSRLRDYPPWNEDFRTWKWMIGRSGFLLGMAHFQVRTVSFREGI